MGGRLAGDWAGVFGETMRWPRCCLQCGPCCHGHTRRSAEARLAPERLALLGDAVDFLAVVDQNDERELSLDPLAWARAAASRRLSSLASC
jgi:hypothetical protein